MIFLISNHVWLLEGTQNTLKLLAAPFGLITLYDGYNKCDTNL